MAVKKILDDFQNALSVAQAGIKGTLKSLMKSRPQAKKRTARKRTPKKKVHDGAMAKPKRKAKKQLLRKSPTKPIHPSED